MQERPRQLYPIVPFAGAEAVPVLFLFLHLPRECLGHTHCTRHPPVACSTYCFPGHSSVEGDGRGRGLLSPEVSAWRLFLGHTTSLKPQQTRNMWIKIIVKYILPNFPRVPREAELHFPQCSVADLLQFHSFPTTPDLPGIPEVTSQLNSLNLNPGLRVCF